MQKFSPENVRQYYDKMTKSYLEIYGDVIQAFRPTKKKDLLNYIATSSGLKRGMKILDAGCGVGGPAIFLAENFKVKIDGITISPVQVTEARNQIGKKKLQQEITVIEGDYHHLTTYFEKGKYDAVYFLESLGHSDHPEKVIAEAYELLRKDGFIYIKDFYRKITDDPVQQARIDKVIHSMNMGYSYNTLDLDKVLHALRKTGFEILFIKRFDFKDDITVRFEFEKENKIDVFEGEDEFYPAEWLEIKCVKVD